MARRVVRERDHRTQPGTMVAHGRHGHRHDPGLVAEPGDRGAASGGDRHGHHQLVRPLATPLEQCDESTRHRGEHDVVDGRAVAVCGV